MALGEILLRSGTPKTFQASGGDAVWTPAGLASTPAGRLTARLDLGAEPRPLWWEVFCKIQCQATPTLNALFRLYLFWWNNNTGPADPDGGLIGASDAAFATEAHLSEKHILNVRVHTAAANTEFSASNLIAIPKRHISIVGWNATGAALTTTDAHHLIRLTPVYDKVEQS